VTNTIYGVVLNDLSERSALADSFDQKPYSRPPVAPVLYIKPATCVVASGGVVFIPPLLPAVQAAPTIALSFGQLPGVVTAAAIAIDVCESHSSYYRPAVRQRCRDGFLPLGRFVGVEIAALRGLELITCVNEVEVHRWSLDRLWRDVPALLHDIGGIMTLADGDVLLVGLPGDAPTVRSGQNVRVTAAGLPALAIRFEEEPA
jgi:5-oxopent-3-ene-1,2,5-tricarboxylate decarboxylase/2-hydroxyhepta-2,4-diene-1,7-dioate isomerase